MDLPRLRTRRPARCSWLARSLSRVFISVSIFCAVLVTISSTPAYAWWTSCSEDTTYEPAQFSLDGDFSGIAGHIYNPIPSEVPGNSGNYMDYDHLAIWQSIYEESIPSGDENCGDDNDSTCWVQAGLFQGFLGYPGGPYVLNSSESWEPYFENEGVNGTYHIDAYPNIFIAQGTSNDFEIFYDGLEGEYHDPQFAAYVRDSNGDLDFLAEDELYYDVDHGVAAAEVEVHNVSTDCPVLTDGTPYQTFGTNSSGNYSSADGIYLQQNGNDWGLWSGSPTVQGGNGGFSPYWYSTITGWPAAFLTSGPANGSP